MFKRSICILTAVLILCAALAGCEDGEASSSSTLTGASGEREKITILTNINVDTEGTDVNDNDYINYLRDAVDLDIEFINAPSNYEEKMNTVMASNQLPDALMLSGDQQRNYLARWATEEMLLPLDDYLPKYCPNLLASLKEEAWQVAKHNGVTYAVPFQRYDSTPYMTFVRKDWMENLGIDPASVKTIDDWYNMLSRFVRDDPDGDGVDNTFGLTSMNSGNFLSSWTFLDSFGAAKAKVVDGELLPNYMLPEYKEWLKFMHKLYEEKILDPEYIVNEGAQMWDKVATGKYGSFLWFWGLQEYLSKGLDRDDLVAMPPPAHADGSEASYVYTSPNRHMMALTVDCKSPENVLKFFDWSCTEEGGIFLYAGLEGKDYNIVDGKIVIKEDRKGKNLGWRQLTLCVEQPNVGEDPLKSILAQSFGDLGMEHLAVATKYGSYNELELFCPIFDELSQYDFKKPVDEFTDKAITGEINIDAEWDKYIENLRKAGGNRKIELSTQWYNNEYKK